MHLCLQLLQGSLPLLHLLLGLCFPSAPLQAGTAQPSCNLVLVSVCLHVCPCSSVARAHGLWSWRDCLGRLVHTCVYTGPCLCQVVGKTVQLSFLEVYPTQRHNLFWGGSQFLQPAPATNDLPLLSLCCPTSLAWAVPSSRLHLLVSVEAKQVAAELAL